MIKIVTHSKKVLEIAQKHGWHVGAKYTNLRNIKTFKNVSFIDIDWQHYRFRDHLKAVKQYQPKYTVAKDILRPKDLIPVLRQAEILRNYCDNVIIVPKAKEFYNDLSIIPEEYIVGYSVPTKYGHTDLPIELFKQRKIHLLGGRPEVQRRIADILNVISIDCNRFTLDAKFGDYFCNGKFVPHPVGGYENCLIDSIQNINQLWEDYHGTSKRITS